MNIGFVKYNPYAADLPFSIGSAHVYKRKERLYSIDPLKIKIFESDLSLSVLIKDMEMTGLK